MNPSSNPPRWTRRDWLTRVLPGGAAIVATTCGRTAFAREDDHPRSSPPDPKIGPPRKKVAAIVTTYYPRSHAYHIVGRFLWGYQFQGRHHRPPFEIASMYCDQIAENDVGQGLARRFDVRRAKTVADALTLGGDSLAVDAVLLIGEHGDYPLNAKGQKLYPRFELFERIVEVMERSKRSVPLFNDKHLSYDRHKAARMVEECERLKIPLMAGSSLPVTWRRPELDLPLGSKITSALVAGYGPDEIYGFHGLETLQCMVERRIGGETGVKAVTGLRGEAVWKAGDAGVWSWDLLEHALGRSDTLNPGDVRVNVLKPLAIVVEYRDGFKGTVLLLNDQVADFNFAATLADRPKPVSCGFLLPGPPGANFFTPLTHHIETFFSTGVSPTPLVRTQLTGGILDVALSSALDNGRRIETPDLSLPYSPPADPGFAKGSPTSPA